MFLAFRKMEWRKRDIVILLLAVVLFTAGLVEWWFLPISPALKSKIENPYFTTIDQKGNRYIINNGKNEILKVSKDCLLYTSDAADE